MGTLLRLFSGVLVRCGGLARGRVGSLPTGGLSHPVARFGTTLAEHDLSTTRARVRRAAERRRVLPEAAPETPRTRRRLTGRTSVVRPPAVSARARSAPGPARRAA